MPRVVHFEVHASDPERTMNFYRELFGWKFQAIPGVGWLAYAKDPEGTIFGMMQSDPSAA